MMVVTLDKSRNRLRTERVTVYLSRGYRVEAQPIPTGVLLAVWGPKGPISSERLSLAEAERMLDGIGGIIDGE